jgi:hypothetical protein
MRATFICSVGASRTQGARLCRREHYLCYDAERCCPFIKDECGVVLSIFRENDVLPVQSIIMWESFRRERAWRKACLSRDSCNLAEKLKE